MSRGFRISAVFTSLFLFGCVCLSGVSQDFRNGADSSCKYSVSLSGQGLQVSSALKEQITRRIQPEIPEELYQYLDIVPGKSYAYQHEYLLFCRMTSLIDHGIAGPGSDYGAQRACDIKELVRVQKQLRRCLDWKSRFLFSVPHRERVAGIVRVLKQLEAGDHERSDSIDLMHAQIRAYFTDLLLMDIEQSRRLSMTTLTLLAREVAARSFTDMFRWSIASSKRVRDDFLGLDQPRDSYYRSVYTGTCLQPNGEEQGRYHFSGRISDNQQMCAGGIYFELDMAPSGRVTRLFFELD